MNGVATIVLAAGTATRLGGPKQFLELAPGLRLVDAALSSASQVSSFVVLVLPEGHQWEGMPVDAVATGGRTRLESAAAGLQMLPSDIDVVIIHDAAHPLAPRSVFEDVIGAIRAGADAAVPFLEAADVVKRVAAGQTLETVGRDSLGLAQVPMAFSRAALESAHENGLDVEAWEDSMLVERMGGRVVAVRGSARNIHVVAAEDLAIVRLLIQSLDTI